MVGTSFFLASTMLAYLTACSGEPADGDTGAGVRSESQQIERPVLQAILDSAELEGSILVYDLQRDEYYSNDFAWASVGRLPASTYKIPTRSLRWRRALSKTIVPYFAGTDRNGRWIFGSRT